jgi:signal transduction histidine kinase
VHPSTIAGSLGALAVTHATAAVCSFALAARRRSSRDLTLAAFAALNLAVMMLDGALAVATGPATEDGSAASAGAVRLADASYVAAAAFLLHLTLLDGRVRAPTWTPAAIYGAAGFLAAASGVGPMGPTLAAAVIAVTTLAGLASLTILAGANARDRREPAGVAGCAILVASLGHDVALHVGWAGGPALAPLGYLAAVSGVGVTILLRLAALRRRLEDRAKELDDRARDLEKAYADLRAAQDQLIRREQLAAVGELSAVVAHEVRNPLAIISNAVATLRRAGIGDEDRETLLQILDEETTRLNRLIRDLLRYARPISLERQLVSMRELVERGMALAKGKIGLDVDLVENEPTERIWADPNLLRQVIENLIDNAIQAMSSGGVLTVALANAEQDGAHGVELQIQDTGDGMDTGVRARALDPFFTTRPSGTGLGLAIVARIVDAHGGSIRIKSKAGAGTVMHVFLPRATQDAQAARRRDSQSGESGRRSMDAVLPPELAKELTRGR